MERNVLMIYKYLMAAICLILLAAGCKQEEVPDLPIARAELTARLMESLNYKRYDEALGIIDKLLALYPDDVELMEMKNRVIVNKCTAKVQLCIDQGKLEEALAIVRSESKKHPMIRKFNIMEDQLKKLIALRDSVKRLADAREIPELDDAINNFEQILRDFPMASQLRDELKLRKKDLDRLRKEKAAADAAAKKRAEEEAKAKAAAVKAQKLAEARAIAAAEAQARADAAKEKAEKYRKNDSGNKFVGPQHLP